MKENYLYIKPLYNKWTFIARGHIYVHVYKYEVYTFMSVSTNIYMQRIFLERWDSQTGDSGEWALFLASDAVEKYAFHCLSFDSLWSFSHIAHSNQGKSHSMWKNI